MTDKYSSWVATAQVVEARYATGDGCHARGVVYAYTDRPTVYLRKADGSKTDWIADLCVPVEPKPGEFDKAMERWARGTGESVAFLESEIAFWRDRAETAEKRLKDAADFYPGAPPEPPLGTTYVGADGEVAWTRREDGWHCGRKTSCFSCPCEWFEAWDFGVGRGGHERRLP